MYPGGGTDRGGTTSPRSALAGKPPGVMLVPSSSRLVSPSHAGGHQRTFPRVTTSPAGVTATGLSPPRRGWILPPGGPPGRTGSAE